MWVVAAAKVPDRNFTVSTELVNEALHEAEVGAVTTHALPEAKAIPAPDSVMTIPPPVDPDAIAELGVNENVAMVSAAFVAEESVIARGVTLNSPIYVSPFISGPGSWLPNMSVELTPIKNVPDGAVIGNLHEKKKVASFKLPEKVFKVSLTRQSV